MTGFVGRLSVLGGIATVIAVGIILLAGGFVEFGLNDGWRSGVVPGLALFLLSGLIAAWYESGDRDEKSS
ncbi:hypothetical protein [Natrinema salifodinae]|uniref:Uncharacterized protein n=1 Tax=Natrinema salifodinae TaxID=1202768 RepID=A0A1I0MYZ5_9EURY|nr:hypothetical protein [Natrinema salifodinae]SEV93985.1 hypothetical protein SAMN05216285_1161 [Natrinema salifodinae]